MCLCPVSQTRLLTDAMNALYSCLPNHALRWLKVSEAALASKQIRFIELEILEIFFNLLINIFVESVLCAFFF